MSKNKGKPTGKNAESKTAAGRKADYKRSGWPEEVATQHVEDGVAKQPGSPLEANPMPPGEGAGRNRKAGSPV